MSNDLISRKLVFADDIHRYIKSEINPYGKPFEGSAYEFGLKIMKYIENMSAAYDVDKAVYQLEKERNIQYRKDGSMLSARSSISIDRAIEIAKEVAVEYNNRIPCSERLQYF